MASLLFFSVDSRTDIKRVKESAKNNNKLNLYNAPLAKVQQVSMGTQLNLQNLVQGSRSSKKQRMKAKQRMQDD